jgi:hypothetical protein
MVQEEKLDVKDALRSTTISPTSRTSSYRPKASKSHHEALISLNGVRPSVTLACREEPCRSRVTDETRPRHRGSRMKSREGDHLYQRKVLEEADWLPLQLA